MPTSPFTPITVSGYNTSPPVDDGTVSEANRVKWATIKTKLTDPLDTALNALEAGGAVASAFAKVPNLDSGEINHFGGVIGFTSSSLTIASGSVTQVRSFHKIDTEASAASDDLDKAIPGTGMAAGDLLILTQVASGRVVTVKNASVAADGAFILNGADFVLSTSDYLLLILQGTAGSFRWKEITRTGSLPTMGRGGIDGLTLSNAADATNDITIAVGAARDDTNADTLVLSSAITKQLDAGWAVGTNQGGLDTGSIANDVYHLWLIKRVDTGVVDVLFSASASLPTMPSNYSLKRRIGSIIRAGGTILAFSQLGDEFLLNDPPLDVDVSNPGTSAVSRTLTVPDGIKVEAIINVTITPATSGSIVGYFSSLDITDEAASATAAPLGNLSTVNLATANVSDSAQLRIRTNISAQIRSRYSASGASDVQKIATIGWVDQRGRNS